MIRNVLVVGGAGFLGKQICLTLNNSGIFNVASADMVNCGIKDIPDFNINILETSHIQDIVKNFDIVINCTGQITSPINISLNTNTIGISNLSDICAKYNKKVLHISTTSVYGSIEKATENSVLNPETPYASLKAVAEIIISNIVPPENLIILRVSNLYGVNQPKGILSYMLKSFNTDRKLEFNNDGSMFRYFQNTSDVSENIVQLLKNKNLFGVFNLPGNECLTIKELVQLVENTISVKFDVSYSNLKPQENILNIECSKIKKNINLIYYSTLKSFILNNFN